MAAAYTAVYLWKKAVEKAGSFEVPKVIAASSEMTLDAPEGEIKVHKDNHHLWKRARIGTLNAQGRVDVIYESAPIEPNPFRNSDSGPGAIRFAPAFVNVQQQVATA